MVGFCYQCSQQFLVEKNRKCIQYDATAALDAENEK